MQGWGLRVANWVTLGTPETFMASYGYTNGPPPGLHRGSLNKPMMDSLQNLVWGSHFCAMRSYADREKCEKVLRKAHADEDVLEV